MTMAAVARGDSLPLPDTVIYPMATIPAKPGGRLMRPKLFVTRRLPESVEDRLHTGFEVTFGSDDTPFDQASFLAEVSTSTRSS
jgi:hypothetical protein